MDFATEHYDIKASALTGDLTEANATAFRSITGRIRVYVKQNSGTIAAGTLTIYTQAQRGDAVYIASGITYDLATAPADASKFSGDLKVGRGSHKMVVSGASGTFNIDLGVKDIPTGLA